MSHWTFLGRTPQAHLGLDYTAQTLLPDREENVPTPRRTAGVDRDAHCTVRRVLEARRHTQRTRQLAVDLRLRRARPDRAPRDEVSGVLRRDCVEELAARRKPECCDVEQELASDAQALVDAEGAVHIWVVYEAFPADGGAGLFEVDPHNNVQVALRCFGVVFELARVFESGLDIVY